MKTQKSFKKRALLSSIAMLLVATVAVGSATFAWFTSNPNATAQGLTLKATASKGLVIQTGSHAKADPEFWGHTDYLNYEKIGDKDATSNDPVYLAATSFDVTGDFTQAYIVDAANDDNYAPAKDAIVATGSSNDYYQEIIKCKLTGGESDTDTDTVVLTDVQLENTGKNLSEAVRIAIQYTQTVGDETTTKLLGVYAPTAQSNKYLTKTGDYEDSLMPLNDGETVKNHTFKAYATIKNEDAGVVDTNGTNYFTITVYLDGEDDKCFTDNIQLSDILKNVTLNLKLKSAVTTG